MPDDTNAEPCPDVFDLPDAMTPEEFHAVIEWYRQPFLVDAEGYHEDAM
jgi:hypothetical protein